MRTRNLLGILVGVLVATAPAAIAKPTVSGVRHAVRDDMTRVVIDLSTQAPYEILHFENPERIAINIRDVRLSGGVKPITIGEGVVERVRFNRLSWGSQVVLDLRERGRWLDFYLAAMDNMPYRIVVDVEGHTATFRSKPRPQATAQAPRPDRPFIVAIDAGHGGSDPGASRHGIIEKTAALDIARRLETELDRRKGYAGFLTRDRDVFLSLPSRTEIARDKGADIFVSIHLNSAPKGNARGTEVFFLSPSGAEATASRLLRNRSRAAAELGLQGGGSDDILHMLVDVNQQSMLQRSSLLAEEILATLHKHRSALPPTRSVKQRSFAVLKSITMPSVMVETGFVTNRSDAKILGSASGRQQMATAIAEGVISFLEKYPPPKDDTGRIVVHRVKKGDTLWRISRQYKTTVASIQKSNKLGSSQVIRVGQELVIRERNGTY